MNECSFFYKTVGEELCSPAITYCMLELIINETINLTLPNASLRREGDHSFHKLNGIELCSGDK